MDEFKEDSFIIRFNDSLISLRLDGESLLLLERVINGFFCRLISDERSDLFIIEDSLFDRPTSRKTKSL